MIIPSLPNAPKWILHMFVVLSFLKYQSCVTGLNHAAASSQYHLHMGNLALLFLNPPTPPPFPFPRFYICLQNQYLIRKVDSGLHTSELWGGMCLVNRWCRLCVVVQAMWKAHLEGTFGRHCWLLQVFSGEHTSGHNHASSYAHRVELRWHGIISGEDCIHYILINLILI